MNYVISFKSTVQVTEDHWVRRKRTLVAPDSMTLAEIHAWYKEQDREDSEHLREPLTITEGETAPEREG